MLRRKGPETQKPRGWVWFCPPSRCQETLAFLFFMTGFNWRTTWLKLCDLEVLTLQTPKPRKTQRHEKVTQKWLSGSRQKWLRSYSKVTQKWRKRSKKTLSGNFWVTFAGTLKVTFELLFRDFEFFRVYGSVGSRLPGQNQNWLNLLTID